MTPETLLIATLVIPVIGAIAIPVFHAHPNRREAVTLITAIALFGVVLQLLSQVTSGARPDVNLLSIQPGLDVVFRIEPLGMLFAVVASGLWIINSIYSIGYMRGNNEPRQTQFYVCFAVAIASTMGIAFAGNLLTLFLFYEILTLSTYPLVTHKANDEARTGGRIYLLILLGTSMVLLLPAIVATGVLAGTIDFKDGGILAGKVEGPLLGVLLGAYAFGIGKAAVMPFHKWLPNAMVAPTPVSALLHAVAVVKAGVFSVLKIVVYIFGIEHLSMSGQSDWLAWVAGATVLLASIVAMTKDNLKARLAYSTVSQLSYIVLGAALATGAGVIGGAMHIATHAVGKITLFMCAGAIYVATQKTEVSQLSGLGRRMPITFGAFLIGALSIIGLPPLAGVWSKWYLGLATVDTEQLILLGVLMVSSLLNIAYLLPIPFLGFFGGRSDSVAVEVGDAVQPAEDSSIKEAPLACLIAVVATSALCILLFIFPDGLFDLAKSIALK